MTALLDGTRVLTMVLASIEHQVIVLVVTQHILFYTNGVSYKHVCVGELGDIRRDRQMLFIKIHNQ